jgi:pSer/pThr/pTyr-binding forkhead associated (FHA) protein
MPALSLLTGPSAGLRHDLLSEATLGRSPSCEIPLDDAKVSRRHAQVALDGGRVVLRDLGSRNGTWLNGTRLEADAELRTGDRFQLGETVVRVEEVAEEPEIAVSSAPVDQLLPEGSPEQSLGQLVLALLDAPDGPALLERLARGITQRLGGKVRAFTVEQAARASVHSGLLRPALTQGEIALAQGMLCAPLTGAGGTVEGVLVVERDGAFNAAEQRLVASVAPIAGRALARDVETGSGLTEPLSGGLQALIAEGRQALGKHAALLLFGEIGTGRALFGRTLASAEDPSGRWKELDARDPKAADRLASASGPLLFVRDIEGLPEPLAGQVEQWLFAQADRRLIATAPSLALPAWAEGRRLVAALTAGALRIPPLRERPEDIPQLFARFVERSARTRREVPCRLGTEARRELSQGRFPRNVSELKLLAEQLTLLHPGAELTPGQLRQDGVAVRAGNLDEKVSELERQMIDQALHEARGKKVRAAAILGISRPTLDKKISEYGLSVEKLKGGA